MEKIFGLGMPKTGTTSLANALRRLGYKHKGYTPEIINQHHSVINKYIQMFDSFADLPWPMLYEYLYEKFPKAKFILTIRSPDTWIKSCIKHFGAATRKPSPHIGGEARKLALGAEWPVGNEELYLQRYTEHNANVQQYFKNLLVVSWERGDGWSHLCKFLNKEIPNEPFPHQKPPFDGGDTFGKTKHFL